ncbi:MAG: 3-phosphoserine/phosphohydroxythreonine transaminase [Flavobacteriales bacterium]|nr:3-phosphoserine/phosphohydroxythreonine transaminase [Flavobacteriales bacterium]
MSDKKHNFSAGPCVLPQEVFDKAAQAVLEYEGQGLSLIEMSHRSAAFVEIMDRAQALVKEMLNVPDGYEVLFLQGGASLGFYMTALNFLNENGKAAYVNTGTWSKKAIKEAKLVGEINVIASSEDKNFSYIPKGFDIPSDLDYLHITSNNTIFGTQFKEFPKANCNLVCDMSSDIFSREVNVSDFAMIYAGAQKNLGPAGTTVYIVKKDLLGKTGRTLPSMLDLQLHSDKGSMFNTPPVFAIYTSMLTLEWLKKKGGVPAMQKVNEDKAALFYNEIERNSLFEGIAAKEDRSNMNATFLMNNDQLTDTWNNIWQDANINGLKGHRSVGGYRASMYNALSIESVQTLVDAMKELEKNHG